MQDISTILRIATIVLLIGWRIYWHITEQQAEKEKPKQSNNAGLFSKRSLIKYVTLCIFGIVGVQLLGISLFPLHEKSLIWQAIGFVLVLIGIIISSIGRHNLGTNWARSYDYQVKDNQAVVTHGIYQFIRHPLYSGITFFLIGSELVVQSYLIFPSLLLFYAANVQAKWEEELLVKHFGNEYRSYMKRTKRFIPYVW